MAASERGAELVDLCGGSSSEEESDGSDLLLQTPVRMMMSHKRKREGPRDTGPFTAAAAAGAEPRAAKARRRSTQSCKAKGRRLQKAVAKDILQAFPALHADDVRSCAMSSGGEDIQLSSAARAVFPYSVEVKNRERLNVFAALAQAEANSGAHAPLLLFSKNRCQTYAAMPWPTLLQLLAASSG